MMTNRRSASSGKKGKGGMLNLLQNRPLYSIGVVSELLDVPPETIRSWEKSGVVQPPQRRSGKRTFSDNDLRRLEFIRGLAREGLTPRAIRYYLRLYPCWWTDDCTDCIHGSDHNVTAKSCWQEDNLYCQESSEDPCASCPSRSQELQPEETGKSQQNQHVGEVSGDQRLQPQLGAIRQRGTP